MAVLRYASNRFSPERRANSPLTGILSVTKKTYPSLFSGSFAEAVAVTPHAKIADENQHSRLLE
jgi:hypothetical protein